MKIIGKIAKIERINIRMIAIAMAATYVIGIGIACFYVNIGQGSSYYIPIGTGIAMIMTAITQVIMRVVTFSNNFNIAVSMGVTRREFLIGYQLFNLAELVVFTVCFWVLYLMEGLFARLCFPKEPMIENMNVLFQIKVIVPFLLVLCCLEIFVEAVTMRFGAKAWWTLWAFWMAMCLGIPRMIERGIKGMLPSGIQRLGNLLVTGGPVLWTVCGVVVLVILVLAAWRMLVKQQVTS